MQVVNSKGEAMQKFNWYWSEKQHLRWQKLRAKGHLHYVLSADDLSWGLTMFLVMALFPYLFGTPFKVQGSFQHLLIGVVLWPLAGALYGIVTWFLCEKSYRKFQIE